MVDFLILGNSNAVTFNYVFTLIKEEKVRLGVTLFSGKMPTFTYIDGSVTTVNSCSWFTTLKHNRVNKFIDLKKFNELSYSQYDNYNAINVDRTEDIPDYDGVMGVPVTFLDKWNPEQFEILGLLNNKCFTSTNGIYKYARILIRRRK